MGLEKTSEVFDLVPVWGMDESGWEWRPDGDYGKIPDDRSLGFFCFCFCFLRA